MWRLKTVEVCLLPRGVRRAQRPHFVRRHRQKAVAVRLLQNDDVGANNQYRDEAVIFWSTLYVPPALVQEVGNGREHWLGMHVAKLSVWRLRPGLPLVRIPAGLVEVGVVFQSAFRFQLPFNLRDKLASELYSDLGMPRLIELLTRQVTMRSPLRRVPTELADGRVLQVADGNIQLTHESWGLPRGLGCKLESHQRAEDCVAVLPLVKQLPGHGQLMLGFVPPRPPAVFTGHAVDHRRTRLRTSS